MAVWAPVYTDTEKPLQSLPCVVNGIPRVLAREGREGLCSWVRLGKVFSGSSAAVTLKSSGSRSPSALLAYDSPAPTAALSLPQGFLAVGNTESSHSFLWTLLSLETEERTPL